MRCFSWVAAACALAFCCCLAGPGDPGPGDPDSDGAEPVGQSAQALGSGDATPPAGAAQDGANQSAPAPSDNTDSTPPPGVEPGAPVADPDPEPWHGGGQAASSTPSGTPGGMH